MPRDMGGLGTHIMDELEIQVMCVFVYVCVCAREKETIYENLVLLCKAKTKFRFKTHLSPLKCQVKKCFCLNLKIRSRYGGSVKY